MTEGREHTCLTVLQFGLVLDAQGGGHGQHSAHGTRGFEELHDVVSQRIECMMGGFDGIDFMIGLWSDRDGFEGGGKQEDGGEMAQDPAKELEEGHGRVGIWWTTTRWWLMV